MGEAEKKETGSGSIENPNLFLSTTYRYCRYCHYQVLVLDKDIAAVFATIAEAECQLAVRATAGKRREAVSGWMDRKRMSKVARVVLPQEPEPGSWSW